MENRVDVAALVPASLRSQTRRLPVGAGSDPYRFAKVGTGFASYKRMKMFLAFTAASSDVRLWQPM